MKYLNKNIFGGDNIINPNKQFQTFLSIIILGYFGVKIVYGFFFNFYPDKYYYRDIVVTSNEGGDNSVTQDITLNAYIPGMWNNEMADFIILIVLSYIIYVYTNVSSKSLIDINGNLTLSFIFGYIIGLGYPPIYVNYKNFYEKQLKSASFIKYIYLILLLAFIMFVIIINHNSIGDAQSYHKTNYIIYCVVIVLVFFGLILGRKVPNNYNVSSYFYNDGQSCSFIKNSVLQTSGDMIKITVPFMVFIILLLFSYEPSQLGNKNLYIFVYGLLLGILVSSISYFGIEYFLQKIPLKQCDNLEECSIKNMPAPVEDIYEETVDVPTTNVDANLGDSALYKLSGLTGTKNNKSTLKIILTIILILICIYLIYHFLVNK